MDSSACTGAGLPRSGSAESCGLEEATLKLADFPRVSSDSGAAAYKSSLFFASEKKYGPDPALPATSPVGGQRRPSHGGSGSSTNSDDDSTGGAHIDSKQRGEHASMNAKRMSMDPAPYDFNDPMFSTDEFRVWEMKIRNCPKSRPHDWTMCPFAHPGEKARRRDPRVFSYCGTACAEYRKSGTCARGDSCMYAHGVFECWLHPSRYRTQLCTDGTACNRRVCFFAHRECELRKPVGGQMAAIPQPQVLDSFSGMNGAHKAHRRASIGAMPMRTDAHSGSSLSAAIQMLDPVSKHRLLEALQHDLHESSQSSVLGHSVPRESARQISHPTHVPDTEGLLEAIQQLQLGGHMSRRSLDDMPMIDPATRHASGLPQYNQYLSSINSCRKSVDIGAVSRLAAHRQSADLPLQVAEVASPGGLESDQFPGSIRSSIDSGMLYKPNSVGMMQAFSHHDGIGSRNSAFVHSGSSNSSVNTLNMSRRPSLNEDSRITLGKIAEITNTEEESEGTRSGGSSSVDTFTLPNSNSGCSNYASMPRNPMKKMEREFSVDNLLAELPRSASQVDLLPK
jgi:hypothetical protein